MTVLKNSQNSTYDLPPMSNGLGSPKGNGTSMGLMEYPMNGETPSMLVPSQLPRSMSGLETYNQPYTSESQMFAQMTPMFTNAAAFQSPKYNYM